ncbi:MAG: ACP S-malonyltransferase, partial [Candidatus Poribacteria bacterium]|nr:ACP S-malonyltransferase [Candidatus Poribacteria bacterium]
MVDIIELAFIFPGQGSQKVGMGLELAQTYPVARATFEEADSVVDRRLSQLCFDGPEEALKQTENTQLAILTCSVATLRVLAELGVSPTIVAGHSLGEYSALVAAESLNFSDALKLVEHRARSMAEASRRQDCTMAAILGLDANTLQAFCEAAHADGVVEIANYNCPGQLIVSGETVAVKLVMESAKTAGARRSQLLPVSGAFHSSLMNPARDSLQSVIDDFPFKAPQTRVVANVTGDFVQTADEIRRLLVAQVTSPVQWEQSIRTIGEAGISHFVEVGPGRVLSGLVRRILRGATCLNVEDVKSLEATIEA